MNNFRSNRLKRIKIQAFLTCFLSLSVLIAAGSATFAWFTTSKTATAKYMNIVTRDSSLVKDIKYYGIKSIDTDNSSYTFTTNSSNVTSLLKYDRELGDGKYQILIEITFKEEAYGRTFDLVSEAKEDILGGKNSWENVDWSKTPFPLSSIIEMTYFDVANTSVSNEITVTKTSSTNTQSFIEINEDIPTFTQNLTLEGAATTSEKPIYVMLDYNQSAITSIYSYNIGNEIFDGNYGDTSSGDSSVTFQSDFNITVRAEN